MEEKIAQWCPIPPPPPKKKKSKIMPPGDGLGGEKYIPPSLKYADKPKISILLFQK